VRALTTEIEIDASPDEVWSTLVDLSRYSEWNPFIVAAEGDALVGSRLRLRMMRSDDRAMTIKPRVSVVDRPRTFEWVGRLGVPGIFTGRHRFELHPTTTGTRLVQSERFTGVLVPFLSRMLEATVSRFVAMNESLRAEIEAAPVVR
jgi:hypothetical protein